jgi:hypothetical protein
MASTLTWITLLPVHLKDGCELQASGAASEGDHSDLLHYGFCVYTAGIGSSERS